MNTRLIRCIYLALITTVLSHVSVGLAQGNSGQAAGSMGMGLMELPDPVALTDKDVTGFMALVTELRELGIDMDSQTMGQTPSMAAALSAQEDVMKTIQKNGFDLNRLQSVGYSVAMALAALGQDAGDMRESMAEMEKMKSSMTPEQWEMATAAMGGAFKMMEQLQNQPAGNLDVVKRHQSELEAVLDN